MRLENEVTIALNLPNIEQARAVSCALDTYVRLALGQIEEITELVRIGTIPVGGQQGERVLASLEQIEQVEALANEIKAVLGYSREGSNSIGNLHVDTSAHRAYEVMKVLDKAIAIQQDPTPKFRGVNYDGLTVRYTKDPEPTAGQNVCDGVDALRAFAQQVMEVWPYGDLDGGSLQEAATKHGLLKPEVWHEPCGENCACVEHATPNEFKAGVTCYRKTALLKGEARKPTAWLVRSKTGLVRTAWTTTPTEEQLAVAECDGDTVTPLFE